MTDDPEAIEARLSPAMHSTLGDHRSPAVVCRERGWAVGQRIVGDEGSGPAVIEITAVGEKRILAKTISVNGKRPWYAGDEGLWSLECRDWQPVRAILAKEPAP